MCCPSFFLNQVLFCWSRCQFRNPYLYHYYLSFSYVIIKTKCDVLLLNVIWNHGKMCAFFLLPYFVSMKGMKEPVFVFYWILLIPHLDRFYKVSRTFWKGGENSVLVCGSSMITFRHEFIHGWNMKKKSQICAQW